ncbi:MAG: hypothetical protein HC837_00545 [Chloroflexaceae bacterium]|nr:hypothetical protein [Chloroflexaceae bacterium]
MICATLAARLARRYSMKRVLQLGMLGNLLSMGLMLLSHAAIGMGMLPFLVLLLGNGEPGGWVWGWR